MEQLDEFDIMLARVDIMLAREDLSIGSKLALLTSEYHNVYGKLKENIEQRPDNPYYAVLVPYKRIQDLAVETYSSQIDGLEDS